MTRGTTPEPWPDQPADAADEYPDSLWPDDDGGDDGRRDDRTAEARRPGGDSGRAMTAGPVPFRWPALPEPDPAQLAAERKRRVLHITMTAVVAAGLGSGAARVYQDAQPAAAPAAAASAGPSQGTGQTGPGTVTGIELVGPVVAVGRRSITIGTGPARPVRAAVTSATRFTGSARTLAAVRVGDTVTAQISVVDGAARVVSLQDPAS